MMQQDGPFGTHRVPCPAFGSDLRALRESSMRIAALALLAPILLPGSRAASKGVT
jgi:hypothetical protein